MILLIKNAQVFQTFKQAFAKKDILIKDNKFYQIANNIDAPYDKLIDATNKYIIPGLIDIHMHIESSMTIPSRFSEAVLPFGTTSVVADPHEIANIFGLEGIKSNMNCETMLDIFYGIPSSVPSTTLELETTGGSIGLEEVENLLQEDKVLCLGEVMNFNDLISSEETLIKKIIELCQRVKPTMPIEGHCPKVSGEALSAFIHAGVTADHTQQTPESIVEKINSGMFLEIQKKSITPETMAIIEEHQLYEYIALVTDDVMVDILDEGHLNLIIKKAVACGMPLEKAIYCSTYTPARRMNLQDRGAIAPGLIADFIMLETLEDFKIEAVYKNGVVVFDEMTRFKERHDYKFPPHFYESIKCHKASASDFVVTSSVNGTAICNVIQTEFKSTFTKAVKKEVTVVDNVLQYEQENLCLLTIFERHGKNFNKSQAFVVNALTHRGAIATSWAHDHHNVMVLGNDADDMALAQQEICEMQGGYVVVAGGKVIAHARLEIGGIVSEAPIAELGRYLREVREAMKSLGYHSHNEIMSFSTLSLPVSPEIKVTDKGIMLTRTQTFIPLIEEVKHEDSCL